MSIQQKKLTAFIFTLLTCVLLAAVAMNDMGDGVARAIQGSGAGMERRAADFRGRQIEAGAVLFGQYCFSCHGEHGQGIAAVAPPLNRKDLLDGSYEKAVGWSGSVDSFIKSTISSGRPIQSRPDLYSARMPTWSNEYGGPLRPDQVDALVSFVLNWQNSAPEVDAWPPPSSPQPTTTPNPIAIHAQARAGVEAGVIATCQDIPAQYAGKISPFRSDDRAALAAGKVTYLDKCAICHGTTGQGNGPAAASLNPKPSDMAIMQELPVDCQFYRISEGVQGTGMPPWKSLGEDAIWQVLLYERSLSGVGLH